MALPTIPLIAGAAVLAVIRPSNVIRAAENVVIGTGKLVGKGATATWSGAKRATHATRVEYKARQIDRARESLAVEAEAVRNMSEAELAELAREQSAILARAEELRAQREAEIAERDAAKARAARAEEIDARLAALREELIAKL